MFNLQARHVPSACPPRHHHIPHHRNKNDIVSRWEELSQNLRHQHRKNRKKKNWGSKAVVFSPVRSSRITDAKANPNPLQANYSYKMYWAWGKCWPLALELLLNPQRGTNRECENRIHTWITLDLGGINELPCSLSTCWGEQALTRLWLSLRYTHAYRDEHAGRHVCVCPRTHMHANM